MCYIAEKDNNDDGKDINCFLSFPFITQNIRSSKSERESKTTELANTGADGTDLLRNLSVFLLMFSGEKCSW